MTGREKKADPRDEDKRVQEGGVEHRTTVRASCCGRQE